MTMKSFTNLAFLVSSLSTAPHVSGFSSSSLSNIPQRTSATTTLHSDATATAAEKDNAVSTDPKEAVKIFGRLAEKYIMLDASAGMCCYSGCTDCEYREPGGGYRMADQSSSRPKWIPVYDHREFQSGKEHTTKWSSQIFVDGPVVTKDEFVSRVIRMDFAPPLGGPYLSASAASIEDETAVSAFFDILAGEKEKLTKHRMGKEMKSLANGDEGLTWALFSSALGAN